MNSWAECSVGFPISINPQHMRMVFHREKVNYVKSSISSIKEVEIDQIKEARVFRCITRDDLQPIEYP